MVGSLIIFLYVRLGLGTRLKNRMVSREDFLQLKSAVQELRSEMRKLAYDTFRLVPTRRKKLEDQLEASSLNAPPEPVLTCVQCGLEYGESSNTGT